MKHMTERDPQLGKWLGTAALGALVMYMLDPVRGRSRRARSGQKLIGLTKKTGTALDRTMRDIGNRLSGIQARIAHLTEGEAGSADDQTLVERVRSALGRAVSNPHSINIAAQAGRITVGGPVLASEKHALLDAVQAVHGVAGVTDQTETHERPDGASSLQGALQVPPRSAMGGQWAPAMRSAAVLGGGALGLYGLMRRSPLAMALGVAGIAMLARGASNKPLGRLLGVKGQAHAIDVGKSIRIEASPEQVYDLWTNYENFPRFMSHVVEVRDLGNQRTHWVVKGPAGTQFEWDAVHTEQSRPHRLAWRSEPGSEIEQAGSVQFEPSRGGTRVTVRLSYAPAAGALGHAIATLLGSDPKRQMDDDLARMKTFIERGAVPHDAAQQSTASSKFLH